MPQWTDWKNQLPTIVGSYATLRELRVTDAPSLMAAITSEVARFVSAPPSSVEDFERFVYWTHRQRAQGKCACFGIVRTGLAHVSGLVQIRMDPTFTTAEGGFALDRACWGQGIFEECAQLLLAFAGAVLGVRRVDAWVCEDNVRAMGALAKIGWARQTNVRRPFEKDGRGHEQVLWTLNIADWRELDGHGLTLKLLQGSGYSHDSTPSPGSRSCVSRCVPDATDPGGAAAEQQDSLRV